jgi:predicted phosphoribosyltransferase
MKDKIITDETLRNRVRVFKDRSEAGRILAEKLEGHKGTDAVLIAIPSGGVPVAAATGNSLNIPLDLVLVRKIQIPWNTEAGFGALDPDGNAIFNEEILKGLRLTREEVESQIAKTRKVLCERERLFRGGREFPFIKGRTVIIVDDGLASGYTMISALRFLKKRDPHRVIVAVPTGPLRTITTIAPEVDAVVCPNIRSGISFAVADAYRNWHDVTDEEVISLINKVKRA